MMDHPENASPTEAHAPGRDDGAATPLEPPAELVGDAPDEQEEAGRGDALYLQPAETAATDPAQPIAFAQPDAGESARSEAMFAPAPPEPPREDVPQSEPAAAEAAQAAPAAVEAAPAEPGAREAAQAEPAAEEAVQLESAAGEAVQPESVAGQAAQAEPAGAATATPTPAQAHASAQADERRARAQQAWERVVNAHAGGEALSGNVTTAVKGGLLVDIGGIRGFLPASQVRVAPGTPLESLVRTKLPLKVIDVDTARRRAVVSHRRAVDDDRRTKRAELLRSLQVGQTREGVVVRLADFGAFVDLGGIDGLIPMRELAFERVDKVQDVLKVGERLPVVVMRIEEGGKKISLSRKNALPDPWRDHAAVLRRDTTVQGKVVGKEPRLQVELAPGIVGTVRESDANPADYEIGEVIEVAVRSVDRAMRRITLTTMHGAAEAAQTAPTSTGFAPLGVELGRRP